MYLTFPQVIFTIIYYDTLPAYFSNSKTTTTDANYTS